MGDKQAYELQGLRSDGSVYTGEVLGIQSGGCEGIGAAVRRPLAGYHVRGADAGPRYRNQARKALMFRL